jgi:hypothetical protein
VGGGLGYALRDLGRRELAGRPDEGLDRRAQRPFRKATSHPNGLARTRSQACGRGANLTFAKGASLKDSAKLFDASLEATPGGPILGLESQNVGR